MATSMANSSGPIIALYPIVQPVYGLGEDDCPRLKPFARVLIASSSHCLHAGPRQSFRGLGRQVVAMNRKIPVQFFEIDLNDFIDEVLGAANLFEGRLKELTLKR